MEYASAYEEVQRILAAYNDAAVAGARALRLVIKRPNRRPVVVIVSDRASLTDTLHDLVLRPYETYHLHGAVEYTVTAVEIEWLSREAELYTVVDTAEPLVGEFTPGEYAVLPHEEPHTFSSLEEAAKSRFMAECEHSMTRPVVFRLTPVDPAAVDKVSPIYCEACEEILSPALQTCPFCGRELRQ